NANGIQKKLDLFEKDSFYIKLKSDSTAWVVLQAILPLYTGAGITSKGPKIKIGLQDQFKSSDYIIDFDWTELKNTTPLHLYIKPENTAVLAIGSSPVHMTAVEKDNQHLKISGHSVMMGYLNNKKNQKIFIKGKMNI
ncbi:MAG: hypothetical protein NZ709_00965, partial [Candidatus Marinimicrobia bacterium]|nr:hypothetical protein [Candidatus Neomarinimicrobiota bacterium]